MYIHDHCPFRAISFRHSLAISSLFMSAYRLSDDAFGLRALHSSPHFSLHPVSRLRSVFLLSWSPPGIFCSPCHSAMAFPPAFIFLTFAWAPAFFRYLCPVARYCFSSSSFSSLVIPPPALPDFKCVPLSPSDLNFAITYYFCMWADEIYMS